VRAMRKVRNMLFMCLGFSCNLVIWAHSIIKTMETEFIRLIDEAILLELQVSRLYLLFHESFPEDAEFWWQLAIEEKNHAALLKTVKKMKESRISIPAEILPPRISELSQTNHRLEQYMEEFHEHPDRNRAFRVALELENSAGELHYEGYMKSTGNDALGKVFKKLNGDDNSHAERIKTYMRAHSLF